MPETMPGTNDLTAHAIMKDPPMITPGDYIEVRSRAYGTKWRLGQVISFDGNTIDVHWYKGWKRAILELRFWFTRLFVSIKERIKCQKP